MATYNKFEGFVGYLGTAVINCNTDTFKVYLSNATPSASADDVKTDLAEISAGNGYTAGGEDTTNTYSETAGTGTCAAVDVTWTATGAIGPFRYVVLYDNTVTSPVTDPLISWWDYGSSISLASGETFTVDFQSNTLFTIA